MTVVDDIKARIDVVDLVSETVKLRRAGKNFTGFCPFHPNSRTPAFVVFPDSGTWRCFGQCNEGGDIFRFVMKKEGWDFAQTLKYLAQRAGVELEPLTPQRQQADARSDQLSSLLEEAVAFYHHYLLQHPAGKPALAYLEKRGLQRETIDRFGLGYAPDGWDVVINHFVNRGHSSQDLLDAGLVTERRQADGTLKPDGGYYDRFRNRIMFPIRDASGKMAGFGARILNPDDVPKFLNSPQTILFDKGKLLYGLDQARKAIRSQDQAVIVEGYLDVIVLHQAGFTNTVSPMGTALTEDQLHLLKRFSRRMVLALDADAAGAKATLRGLEVARQALDREDEIRFDARGLVHHEGRLKADLRVTAIPEGMDPDEVALRDPEEWRRILSTARPIVVHVMETLAEGQDLDDPKIKSGIAARILPLIIEDVPDPVERDAYRQRLARLLRIDERVLIGSQAAQTHPGRRPVNRPGPRPARTGAPEMAEVGRSHLMEGLERHCLRLLLRKPDAVYLLDRALQRAGLVRLSTQDFEQAGYQVIVRVLLESLEQDQVDGERYLSENLPEELQELAAELRAPLEQGEPNADRLNEELLACIVRIRRERTQEGLKQLRFFQTDPDVQASGGIANYVDLVMQYSQTLGRLDRAISTSIQLDE